MKKPVPASPPTPPKVVYDPEMTGQAADVGKTLIQAISPADKGWVLGFIVVVAIIVGADSWVALKTIDQNVKIAEANRLYFEKVEANRATAFEKSHQTYSDQQRRSQEVIKALAASVARDSERAGDAALMAITEKSRRQAQEKIDGQP